MNSFLRTLFASSLSATTVLALAQGAPPVVSVKVTNPLVAAGKPFSAVVTVTFAEGLHGYQNPPTDPSLIPIAVSVGDKVFAVLSVRYPLGIPTKVAGEDKPVNVYQGTIKIPLMLKAPTKLGKAHLKLKLDYQECNDQTCFGPSSVTVDANVTVTKPAATGKKASKS